MMTLCKRPMKSRDIDLENQYYQAKALKEDDPKAAIEALSAVVAAEEEKGDWGFKSLKQICKISFNVLNDKEATLKSYKRLLAYTKSAVTKNTSEKALNNILEYVSKSDDTVFMQDFYAMTLENLAEAKNDRLWLKTNLKLAKVWLDRKEFGRLNKILKELHAACETKDGEQDQSKGSHLLEVYALEIQMYTETKNTKRLKEIYQRTLRIKSSITHPRILGIIRECGGKMHMHEKNWVAAQEDFFESFRNYDEAGLYQRISVLKYLVLANMLMQSEINPFESQETKPYKQNPEIQGMMSLVDAYQRNDIDSFERILREHRGTIMSDPFIAQYVGEITVNVRTAVLLKLVASYSRIQISFMASELNISENEVEQLVIQLILDDQIDGVLDEQLGRLEMAKKATGSRAEVLSNLVSEVDYLWRNSASRIGVPGN
ncbi:PCI domain-domain-containing protein [Protomyces lactucae-debilis]|uniref:COP9 signalosome complex subunit 2 n=1 Tax=Protomyces lactucae-debilis TaxID=2754530 RepID=A0A1Y2FFH5_PROLT|nr:PCI domain-containing protein [Protomyces lactucae-debilis]ORY82036.1 PCI domain-domain-containing protein [Protomyces lactucae-debilis]